MSEYCKNCEKLEEENKELQYQIACSRGREQAHLRNSVFWETLVSKYKQALDEIEEIANEPCIADTQEDCKSCDGNCEHKDILGIIRKAKGADNHG